MTEVQNNGAAQTNKEVKPDSTGTKTLKGFVLWGIVLAGYLLFCFNWMVMDNMAGKVAGVDGAVSSGWWGAFFGSEPGGLVSQAPNWTLTFMRGVGAFLAGWVLVKIGHKYAVTIAISLLAFGGITAPLVGLMGNKAGLSAGEDFMFLFVLFLVLRMIMAVGATTLIVYTQPVIATYFNDSQKKTTNLFNAVAFNVGSMIAIGILMLNANVNTFLLNNWILFTSLVSCTAIILLVLWLVLAEPIATPDDPNDTASYGSVLAEKRTWMYAIMFGLWLTWVVLFLTMLEPYFMTPIAKANGVGKLSTPVRGMWKILFLAGLFGGIPIYSWLANQNYGRRPVAMISILVGVALTMATAFIGAFWLTTDDIEGTAQFWKADNPFALVMFYLTSFLAGIAAWGVQGYMLGSTYLFKGATPKKQGIVIGACWGIGYMGETIITILLSFTKWTDASNVTHNAPWVFFVLFILASIGAALMWLLIPESAGKNPHPDSINA